MIVSSIVLLLIAGLIIYLTIFMWSKLFGESRTFRLQMLVVVIAGLLGAFLLLLLENQKSPLGTFVSIGIIVLAICAAFAVAVLQVRKVNRERENDNHK